MKKYGCGAILFDLLMTMATGGLWIIWIFVKYLRTH
jgi:hypothetical protein